MDAHIDPSRENFDRFKALPRDVPIHMLNLIRYRKVAIYPDGHRLADAGWSGRQAYEEYHRGIAPILRRVGASMVWQGMFDCVVTGPEEWPWDETFVMGYPNAAAFMALVKDPEYRPVVVHRRAAVFDSRLVRFSPRGIGD